MMPIGRAAVPIVTPNGHRLGEDGSTVYTLGFDASERQMRNCLLLTLAFLALSTLAGCGNKGPLYLPPSEPAPEAVPDDTR